MTLLGSCSFQMCEDFPAHAFWHVLLLPAGAFPCKAGLSLLGSWVSGYLELFCFYVNAACFPHLTSRYLLGLAAAVQGLKQRKAGQWSPVAFH